MKLDKNKVYATQFDTMHWEELQQTAKNTRADLLRWVPIKK